MSLIEARPGPLTSWFRSVDDMLGRCRFDPGTGKWMFYLEDYGYVVEPGLVDKAVAELSICMIRVFVLKRWEIAAL